MYRISNGAELNLSLETTPEDIELFQGGGQAGIVVGLEDELQKFIHVPALIHAPRGHFDCV